MGLLDVESLTLQYKTSTRLVTAPWRVSFEVERYDRLVILGPSGCGKSTLLKALGGFMRPVEGVIGLNDKEIRQPGPPRGGCTRLVRMLLTLHPSAAGRTYAAYGGMYIAVALVWLWVVDGVTLSVWDLAGASIALIGMAVIALQPGVR